MQAYGLIIALFVNIFSKETNRQLKRGASAGGWVGSREGWRGAGVEGETCLAFSLQR